MEIIEVEKQEAEEQSTTTKTAVVDPSSKKTKVSVPLEIIEDILLRLPAESILRSTAVSKPWYSIISHPSFSTLQLTHATLAHRTALFISAYDPSNSKRHYLSASSHGGPLNLLMSVDQAERYNLTPPTHSNGLISFTSETWLPELINNSLPFITTPVFINPSTRKVFKLPATTRPLGFDLFGHLYGFDESKNQHKILFMNDVAREFMVFDMSLWRKIEAEPPVGLTWDDIGGYLDGGVSFDSKVHVMIEYCSPEYPFEILAFDFVTEKFSLMRIPQDAWPHIWVRGEVVVINNKPFIAKISGCLGVVVYDQKRSEIFIWVLQDYVNGVWVKETITLPEPWKILVRNFPLSIDATMDEEIIFNINSVSENVITVPVYNRKTKSFRTLEFTLDGQVLSSETVRFHNITHYVDSIVPV